jgi:hypothetical protein
MDNLGLQVLGFAGVNPSLQKLIGNTSPNISP